MTRWPAWHPRASLHVCGGDDCPYSNADDGAHAPEYAESGLCSWGGEGCQTSGLRWRPGRVAGW